MNALEGRVESNTSSIQSSIIRFLRNQHRLAQVLLSVALSGEKSPWAFDKFSFDFAWILAQHESVKFDKVLANETVELIAPLFIIAVKAGMKEVRSEAIRLLERTNRVEAYWDSQTALQIAQDLIAWELLAEFPTQDEQLHAPAPLSICLHNISGMWVSTDYF